MIRAMRTMQVRICENTTAFFEWAHEFAEYLNEKFPETEQHFFRSATGTMHLACWMSDHEDIAAWERWRKATIADEGYQERARAAPWDAVVDGSDTITLFGGNV